MVFTRDQADHRHSLRRQAGRLRTQGLPKGRFFLGGGVHMYYGLHFLKGIFIGDYYRAC